MEPCRQIFRYLLGCGFYFCNIHAGAPQELHHRPSRIAAQNADAWHHRLAARTARRGTWRVLLQLVQIFAHARFHCFLFFQQTNPQPRIPKAIFANNLTLSGAQFDKHMQIVTKNAAIATPVPQS
jgi:hypothetical protein